MALKILEPIPAANAALSDAEKVTGRAAIIKGIVAGDVTREKTVHQVAALLHGQKLFVSGVEVRALLKDLESLEADILGLRPTGENDRPTTDEIRGVVGENYSRVTDAELETLSGMYVKRGVWD